MPTTAELRAILDRFAGSAYPDLTLQYDYPTRMGGSIDVVISKAGESMALGRFRKVGEKEPGAFSDRFRMAMGYPEDVWYLFDFDGERLLINDLSKTEPADEIAESVEKGLHRLCTLPTLWHQMVDMNHFLEAFSKSVDP